MVSNGVAILSNAGQAGDEALLLAESLKGRVAVISDADRVSAADWAIENLKPDVFVLDDGFQNLRIARRLNIVTIDATNPWGNRRLLPAGSLREPLAELARADCIVITRADDPEQVAALQREIDQLSDGRPVFRSRMKTNQLRPVNTDPKIQSAPVAAFCGIGNPDSFFSQLRREGYTLCHTQAFRDHRVYTQADIDELSRASIASGAEALLTTAKDEVKLRSLNFTLPCYVVEIAIEIENDEKLQVLIDEAVRIKN